MHVLFLYSILFYPEGENKIYAILRHYTKFCPNLEFDYRVDECECWGVGCRGSGTWSDIIRGGSMDLTSHY